MSTNELENIHLFMAVAYHLQKMKMQHNFHWLKRWKKI